MAGLFSSVSGWATFVGTTMATLISLATLTRLVMWWKRKSADKYTEEWDKIMARCGRGEKVGELLSMSDQILRAACTCDEAGTVHILQRRELEASILFSAT